MVYRVQYRVRVYTVSGNLLICRVWESQVGLEVPQAVSGRCTICGCDVHLQGGPATPCCNPKPV